MQCHFSITMASGCTCIRTFFQKTLNILILIKGNHAVECVKFAYIEKAQVLAPSKTDKVTKASDMETVFMLVAFCS